MMKSYKPCSCTHTHTHTHTHNMFTRSGKHTREKGITLIALIITVILLLILAGIAISAINGGLFSKVNEAKVKYDLSVIQEEIDTYVLGQQLYQESGIDLYPVLLEDGNYVTMANSGIDTNSLPDSLKQKLLLYTGTTVTGEIPTIDYTQFYKIDTSKVQSAKGYGDLYLYYDSTGYKVISLKGITLGSTLAYVVIPWNDTPVQYVATSNNTYKLCSDGTLKVIGQLSELSGATTQELDSFNGLQEFVLPSEAESGMAQPVNNIYFNCNTAYVIDKNDDLWAWGDNTSNKLGLGNSYVVTKPTKIAEGVSKVWGSYNNSWYLGKDGKLYAAGDNTAGTLGQGNTDAYDMFVLVPGITGTVSEVVGAGHLASQGCVIICDNGKVYGAGPKVGLGLNWGDNLTTVQELVNFEGYDKILYLGLSTFLLKNSTLYAVGYNYEGLLGIGDISDTLLEITQVPISNVIDVAPASNGVGIVIETSTGELYVTASGKMGVSGVEYDGIPVKVNGGPYTGMKLSNNGLYLMDNKIYVLGYDSETFQWYGYQAYSTFTSVSDTFDYTFAPQMFKENDKIYIDNSPNITTFGKRTITSLKGVFTGVSFIQGISNQINIVTMDGEIYENLTNKNAEISNVSQLISSSGARYALTKDGKLFAKNNFDYGGGTVGGWGDTSLKTDYTQILKSAGIPFDNVKKIFVVKDLLPWVIGYPECIFITEDNQIYWMGADYYICFPGAVGDTNVEESVKVTNYPKNMTNNGAILSNIVNKIKDIRFSNEMMGSVSIMSTLIVTDDGDLYTVSNNANTTGLGNGTIPSDFVLLNNGTGNLGNKKIIEARIGGGTSFAVTSTGEVYAWGYNYYGLMGPGFNLGAWYPTPQKLSISNIKSLEVGDGFAIFIGNSSQIWGIGNNAYGQLGDGTTTSTNTFVRCTELEK